MSDHYSREGKPIPPHRWHELVRDRQYRVLAQTTLAEGGWVSTLWLGVDQASIRGRPPLIFETAAFGRERLRRRYATEEEALKGHDEIVEQLGGAAVRPTRPEAEQGGR